MRNVLLDSKQQLNREDYGVDKYWVLEVPLAVVKE